jgi:hypothetical protein
VKLAGAELPLPIGESAPHVSRLGYVIHDETDY